jgi:phosphopantetheinyl transferase
MLATYLKRTPPELLAEAQPQWHRAAPRRVCALALLRQLLISQITLAPRMLSLGAGVSGRPLPERAGHAGPEKTWSSG